MSSMSYKNIRNTRIYHVYHPVEILYKTHFKISSELYLIHFINLCKCVKGHSIPLCIPHFWRTEDGKKLQAYRMIILVLRGEDVVYFLIGNVRPFGSGVSAKKRRVRNLFVGVSNVTCLWYLQNTDFHARSVCYSVRLHPKLFLHSF